MSGTKGLHVRLPDELHHSLAIQADRAGLSLNSLIVQRLQGFTENNELASTVDSLTAQQDKLQSRLERLERLAELGGMQ